MQRVWNVAGTPASLMCTFTVLKLVNGLQSARHSLSIWNPSIDIRVNRTKRRILYCRFQWKDLMTQVTYPPLMHLSDSLFSLWIVFHWVFRTVTQMLLIPLMSLLFSSQLIWSTPLSPLTWLILNCKISRKSDLSPPIVIFCVQRHRSCPLHTLKRKMVSSKCSLDQRRKMINFPPWKYCECYWQSIAWHINISSDVYVLVNELIWV